MKVLIVDQSNEYPVMAMGEHPKPVHGKGGLLVKVKAAHSRMKDNLNAGKII